MVDRGRLEPCERLVGQFAVNERQGIQESARRHIQPVNSFIFKNLLNSNL